MKTKVHKIKLSDYAYELAKKSAKRDGLSQIEWLGAAVELYANSDRKLKRIAKHISTLRGLLFGKIDGERTSEKSSQPVEQPAPKAAEAPAPEEDKFAEQRAALHRLMEQYAIAHKAGDTEAMERIAAEGRAIKAMMVG